MRARSIKPGLFLNEQLGCAEPLCTVIFQGLWCMADREGRLEDRPMRIHASINPYRELNGTKAALDWLAQAGFIQRYTSGGRNLLFIVAFHKHQIPHHMEAPSVLPPPPGISDRFNHEPITKRQRIEILSRDKKCVQCGSSKDLHIDHIIPVSAGGTSENDNLRVLCKKCNLVKGKKIIDIGSTLSRDRVDIKSTNPPSIPLTPDSGLLIPDSGLLIPDSPSASATPTPPSVPRETKSPARRKSVEADPDWLLDFKLAYPNRAGDQGWRKAVRAANARMAEGHTTAEFLAGARRYAAYCDATGATGTVYAKQAATFLGPDKPFLLDWTPPPTKAQAAQNKNLEASREWLATCGDSP